MNDRDRLIELLFKVTKEKDCPQPCEVADYLLANGVRIIDTKVINPKNRELTTHFAGMPINDVLDLVRAKKEGTLIALPCKVGDRLFCIFTDRGINEIYNHIEACKVTNIMCFDNNNFVVGVREINKHFSHNVVLGKDAFNTFEEAEEKLKELGK